MRILYTPTEKEIEITDKNGSIGDEMYARDAAIYEVYHHKLDSDFFQDFIKQLTIILNKENKIFYIDPPKQDTYHGGRYHTEKVILSHYRAVVLYVNTTPDPDLQTCMAILANYVHQNYEILEKILGNEYGLDPTFNDVLIQVLTDIELVEEAEKILWKEKYLRYLMYLEHKPTSQRLMNLIRKLNKTKPDKL